MINLKRLFSGNTAMILRENRGFIVDHIGNYAALNICGGIYLAGLLHFMGFADSVNGTVLAIPVLGGLFQIVGPLLLARTKNPKKLLVLGAFMGKLCLGLIFFIPIIFQSSTLGAILVVIIYSLGHIILAMIAPALGNWIMVNTRPDKRSGFFSIRERMGLASIAIATMSASALLDYFAQDNVEQIGYVFIGAGLAIVSVWDLFALNKMVYPESIKEKKINLKSIITMLGSKDILKVLVLTMLWQLAFQIWIPHNSIYIINNLGVSYSLMGFLGIVCSVEKILLMSAWNRYTSRTSFEHSFFLSLLLLSSAGILWMIATPSNANFMIIVVNIYSSVSWAVIGIALYNVQYDSLDGDDKVLKMGIIGGLSGVGGFLFSLLGSFIINTVDAMGGFLGIDGQKIVIAIGSIAGFALTAFLYFGFIPKDKRPTLKSILNLLRDLIARITYLNHQLRTRRHLRKTKRG